MSQPRQVIQQFFDMFAAGKIAETRDLFAPTCVTLMPGGALDVDQHEAMGHAFKNAFPDSRMVVDHAVENGQEVVILGRFRGTHSGDFVSPEGTIPASGNDLDLRFIDYFHVDGDQIADHQTVFDRVDLLRQMGAMPN